jgi:hypothetical protein
MDLGRDWPRAPLRRRSEGFFFFFFSPTFFSSLKEILLLLLLGELDDCVFHLRRDFKPVGIEIESQSNREENVFFWLGDENGNEIFLSLKNFFGSCGKRTNAHHNSKWPIFHLSHFSFVLRIFFFLFFLHLFGERRIKMVGGKNVKSWGDLHFRERDTHKKTYNKRLEKRKRKKRKDPIKR